ncbi:very long chain fatty acid elongase 5-like [Antedon mediterranea]|uniref:very long chain fatty acid elongase 5-like n=1 Tax=Antedon mediterranea TaxID=105859 RepID=UPI003AF98665
MDFSSICKTFVGLQSFPVMIIYLIIVILSPYYQKVTKPISPQKLMICYNVCCSVASSITGVVFIIAIYQMQSLYLMETSELLKQAYLLYWMMKNFELMDTVFMILRHKHRQISFLHVYHHASMVLLTDYAYHLFPYVGIAFIPTINSFIHVCLYSYYAYTALNPSNPPAWKRYLTQLQILQFLLGGIHAMYGYAFHNFCIYSLIYAVVMISLFSNFYYQAYIKKRIKSV